MHFRRKAGVLSKAICVPFVWLLLIMVVPAQDTTWIQHNFETGGTYWSPGPADAEFKVAQHKVTDELAHDGRKSEYFQLQVKRGKFIHYLRKVGRAPVDDQLVMNVWIKANRPGVRILARVVLPHERDPQQLDRPLTTIIRGDQYLTTGRWQRVEVNDPLSLLKKQQRLLQVEEKRKINIDDAYVDQVILDLYAGPGLSKIWTDDLEVGPIVKEKKPQPQPKPPTIADTPDPKINPIQPRPQIIPVSLEQDKLLVGKKPFFFRGIQYSGTPPKTLADAGFNTFFCDATTDPKVIAEAAKLGFWLVPRLPDEDRRPLNDDGFVRGTLTARTQLVRRSMSPFLNSDAVLFWNLGSGLAKEQFISVSRQERAVHRVDPMRPVAVDVWDGYQKYVRGVDQIMLGAHRWPLMTSLELPQYREWLVQRRRLGEGAYTWTWIQTHLPEWYTQLVYNQAPDRKFDQPIGPQPEQIRLLAYTAIASGVRGLGFWSDRFLADSHTGRDRLLQLALLNMELQLLEPLLVTADPPRWVETSQKEVQAAVMRTDHGTLVIPIWIGKGSQMVPGQSAAANLSVVVPIALGDKQAWEVSPGEVRTIKSERVAGGTKITIPEFGLCASVVLTGDLSSNGLIVRFQKRVRRIRMIAAQWAHDLAKEELTKVVKVYQEMEQIGRGLPEGRRLLQDAERRVRLAETYRKNGDARRAYKEAQRALRPLRILMRAQWEKAVEELETPMASPYALSYFTLPRHWELRDQISRSYRGKNVLVDGEFEQVDNKDNEQWQVQEVPTLDEVALSAQRVSGIAHAGKQSLLLEVQAKDPKLAPLALERTFIAVHSPKVKLKPGTLVRITAWARVPATLKASADGALMYDSAAGEPLAIRISETQGKWKRFSTFRYVPPSGEIQVTLALTGLGKVYFDDVKIEPLTTAAEVRNNLRGR